MTIPNPAAARRLGIGMVFQHFSLFDALTVAENIALALAGGIELRRARRRGSAKVSAEYGLPLNPDSRRRRPLRRRAPARRDRPLPAAGARAHHHGRADLGADAAGGRRPLRHPARLAAEGCSVLYISHRLEEVQAICHHATILRAGKVVGRMRSADGDGGRLASLMVGGRAPRAVRARAGRARRGSGSARDLPLNAEAASLCRRAGRRSRSTCAAARSSPSPASPATARTSCSTRVSGETPRRARRCGSTASMPAAGDGSHRGAGWSAFVPEERLGHGAVPRMPLCRATRPHPAPPATGWSARGVVNLGGARAIADRVDQAFDVRKGIARPGGERPLRRQSAEVRRRPRIPAASPACSSSASRPGASMPAPRPPSARR